MMQVFQSKTNFINWLGLMFKEFFTEISSKSVYEVIDLFECEKTGYTKVVLGLSGRHLIERNVHEIITDNHIIEGLDKKTIRTLTYIATREQMKPDFSVIRQQLSEHADEYLLELKSRNKKVIIKKTAIEIAKDKSLLERLGSIDASRIGYLAGVRETVKEYSIKKQMQSDQV